MKQTLFITILIVSLLFANDKLKANNHSSELNVIMFGDSLTAGYGLKSKKEALPNNLEKKLKNMGLDINITNSGVSGDTTASGYNRLAFVLNNTKYDYMILALGGNDVLRSIDLSSTKENLENIIKYTQKQGVKVILIGMYAPPNLGKEYQNQIVKIFTELAKKYNLPLYPFILEGVAANLKLNQDDGIHPNLQGVEVIANNLAEFLYPLFLKK